MIVKVPAQNVKAIGAPAGFAQTGQRRQLRDGLWEVELEFGELP